MKNIMSLIVASLMAILILPVNASSTDKKFVIGYANLADTDVFSMRRKLAFIQAAKADPNIKILFSDATGDISKQLDQIDNFIAQKVNAIIVVPVDYQGIVPGVEMANKAGIPVISLGSHAGGGKFTFVGSDSKEAGRLQGEFMKARLPKNAKVLYLQGTPGQYDAKERLAGFMAAGLTPRPDVKLLAKLPANYDRAEGMKITEDWIQRFPSFDAIIAANDQMALGAMEALKVAGRLQGVLISGIDGTGDALKAINAGGMSQSIFQNAKSQGDSAFDIIQMAKKGQSLPSEKLIPFESIVKENVAQYLTK